MRKLMMYTMTIIIAFFLVACSASTSEGSDDTVIDSTSIKYNIREELEAVSLPTGYDNLLAIDEDGDYLLVSYDEGKIRIYIYAGYNFSLPYLAEYYLPVAVDAIATANSEAEDVEISLDFFMVYYKSEETDSSAYWKTEDGEVGTLTDNSDDNIGSSSGVTIEELYEAYQDYEEWANEVIVNGDEAILTADSDISDDTTDEDDAEQDEVVSNPIEEYELLTADQLKTMSYIDYNYCFDIILDKLYIVYNEYSDDYDISYIYWYESDGIYTCTIQGSLYGITTDDPQYIFVTATDGDIIRMANTTNSKGYYSTGPYNIEAAEIIGHVDLETEVYSDVRENYPNMVDLYEDIERNPDDYSYDHCYVKGTIFQIIKEGSNSATYLLETSAGYVYVHWYEDEETRGSRLLEGDSITIYGCTSGLTSYTTVWGVENKIPEITVYFIDTD